MNNTNQTIERHDTQSPALSTKEYQKLDAAHHIHAFLDQNALNQKGALVIVRGQGVHLWDSDGKHYIDGMSGLWCTNIGYGRPELIEAATQQLKQLSYYNMFFHTTHPAVINLSQRLFNILPSRYSHIVYTNSGSETNEVLIRAIRSYWDLMGKPNKKTFIGRHNGYHGSTVGSASLGGMKPMHKMGDLPIPGVAHINEPYWYMHGNDLTPEEFGLQCARELEQKILELGADNVAAFIGEPFQGAGGMIFPPDTYWPEIQRICRQYDVLLCADEVIGGFGRTGEWFSHQHFGFEPDTISIAKGLTSGYIPMGGLILSKKIADVLVHGGVFAHGLTYSGHPVAAAVASANIDILQKEKIIERVKQDTGPYFQKKLRETFANHPIIGDVQGAGLVAALQLAEDKATRKRFANENDLAWNCRTYGFEEGVVIRSTLGRIVMSPALTINHAEIDQLIAKTKAAVDRVARDLHLL